MVLAVLALGCAYLALRLASRAVSRRRMFAEVQSILISAEAEEAEE